ncbi:MAG: TIR domain-containing protein [Opitutaceae bacterium]|nr:TIR domain-containing protein [Opitutaceae bacterium]
MPAFGGAGGDQGLPAFGGAEGDQGFGFRVGSIRNPRSEIEMSGAPKAVFLSYASQDADAARKIADALRGAQVEVWFDQSELRGGDAWDAKIRKQIKECALFVPIISANTQARLEGYFRIEWKLAAQRTHAMAEAKPFLLPVVIDTTRDAEAHVPGEFRGVQWTRLHGGEIAPAFAQRVRTLLEGVRTTEETSAGVAPDRPLSGGRPVVGHSDGKSERSVAVLAFANMSGDRENEYLSDGISEDLITALSQVAGLRVPARTSAFAFKGKNEDVRLIAQLLNVETVLEGSVRKSGSKLRITAQLVKAADGFHLWSERYDREMKDVFEIQDEITRAIMIALQVHLGSPHGGSLVKPTTASTVAYEYYLKGRDFFYQRGVGLLKAHHWFELALLEDPKYARAWSGMADTMVVHVFYGLGTPAQCYPKARAAAERAISLDPNLGEAHASHATVLGWCDWQFPESLAAHARAMELDPRFPLTYAWHGATLAAVGSFDESIDMEKRATLIDPLSPYIFTMWGWMFVFAGRFEESLPHLHRALALKPDYPLAQWVLGHALALMGRCDESIRILESATETVKHAPWMLGYLGHALGRAGETQRALQIAEELSDPARQSVDVPFYQAVVWAGLGDVDNTLRCLEKACDERHVRMTWLRSDETFRDFRNHPRFQELIRKIGLPPAL